MTRKEAHAAAIRLLEEAEDKLDQASALFRDARTAGSIEVGSGPYRVTGRSVTGIALELVNSAREARCEDCDKLVADCECAWASQEVR